MLEFQNVLHVPDLRNNLLSVLYLTQNKNYIVTIEKDKLYFRQHDSLLFTASVNAHNSAYLDGHAVPFQYAALASTCQLDRTLWHRRFAHLNHASIRDLISKELVQGMTITSQTPPDPICEPCIAGKQHRGPIPRSASHHATQALELVHSDVHGPLPVQSRHGYKYWITFIDDHTRFWSVYLMSSKSEAFSAFKKFKAYAENQLGSTIKPLRDDKGGEYMSNEFNAYLAAAGITRQHTVRNEPHQNGVAERANRTIAEGITAMLNEARLPASFWEYAINVFVHVHNRSPTAALSNATPFTKWHGYKPDVSHFRVFGCVAYVHVQKDQRRGLESVKGSGVNLTPVQ